MKTLKDAGMKDRWFVAPMKTACPVRRLRLGLAMMMVLCSSKVWSQQPTQQAGSPPAKAAAPAKKKPASAKTPKPSPPPSGDQNKPTGLNIALTCRVSTGRCSVTKYSFPPFRGLAAGTCPALESALQGKNAEEEASLAQFLAANMMPQPDYTLSAFGDTVVFSKSNDATTTKQGATSKKSSTAMDDEVSVIIGEIKGYLGLLNSDPNLIPPLNIELNFRAATLLGGDPSTVLQNATGGIFQVQQLTSTRAVVSSSGQYPATCSQWANFLRQAGEIAQSAVQVSPIYRTYQIEAGDAAAALNEKALASAASKPSNPANTTGGKGGGTGKGADDSSGDKDNSNNTDEENSNKDTSSAKNSKNKQSSSDAASTTKSGKGNSKKTSSAAPAAKTDDATQTKGNETETPPTSTATNLPLGHPGDDLLIFTGSGVDAQNAEKQRILAAMDLPRPQMIVNGWVLQSSSKDADKSAAFRNQVTQFVNEQNDALQRAILTGWQVVKLRIKSAGKPDSGKLPFFDREFTNYLTQRKAYDPLLENIPAPDSLAVAMGGMGPTDPKEKDPMVNPDFCASGQYCLGYTELFEHPQPRLTDLMLTFIAAQNPPAEVNLAVDCVEASDGTSPIVPPCTPPPVHNPPDPMQRDLAKTLVVAGLSRPGGPMVCDQRDLLGINSYADEGHSPRLFLECFREGVNGLLADSNGALGPIRAALADFLFNYKMSQMYPHEFAAYDLTQSAVALDRSLEPLIDAFNRDIAAFQVYWEYRVAYTGKRLLGEKQIFYGGVISVRTVGGNASSASTTTQSFLNISQAPQINTLLTNLAGAASAASPAGVLADLSGNQAQALKAALESYQTTEAQVGRTLSVQVQPRSLAGASAAEMDVTFHADESAKPSYWSNAPANNTTGPDLSRVASHDITTHVRVDSLNLFEISSMTAILNAGRTKLPLLPPFVEIPYIGTLAGIPLPPAESYQTSTAILSAVVVPTATDLANGLRFRSDLVLEPLEGAPNNQTCSLSFGPGPAPNPACHVRNANSMDDLGGRKRLIEFNRKMVECYASGDPDCYALTFSKILVPRN